MKNLDNENNKLAFDMFCIKIQNYIGRYLIALEKCDAIIFTGGIGENSQILRDSVCQNISKDIEILVIPTNEELEISIQAMEILN